MAAGLVLVFRSARRLVDLALVRCPVAFVGTAVAFICGFLALVGGTITFRGTCISRALPLRLDTFSPVLCDVASVGRQLPLTR